MRRVNIGIVTIADDIHAHLVRHELRTRHFAACHLIEVDRISSVHQLNWSSRDHDSATIIVDDVELPMRDLDVVWWRRSRATQVFDGVTYELDQLDVINNDCRAAFLGQMLTRFHGKWISHPIATEQAGNKLFQLTVAHSNGFRVPRTLVTQSKERLGRFIRQNSKGTIVKTVAGGVRGVFLFTRFVTEEMLAAEESIRVAPAIYQEYIPGSRHIRLNIFGDQAYAASIETEELDWRPNLNVPVQACSLPDDILKIARNVLNALSLEMGVIDLKMTPEGEFVWLEVNPQGQFLFLEPLTGIPYSEIFAAHLVAEARNSRQASAIF